MSARAVFERAFLERDGGLVHFGATPESIARRANGPVYLASPISLRFGGTADAHWYVLERILREAAMDCDALALAGVSAISPAVLALEMIRSRGLGWERSVHGAHGVLDRDFWLRWCAPVLRVCSVVVVADRAGWDVSDGIAGEVQWATSRNVPVFFMASGPSQQAI